jgi:signal transduction histidine kinase
MVASISHFLSYPSIARSLAALLLLLFSAGILWGQPAEAREGIDSLKRAYQGQSGIEKVRTLDRLSDLFWPSNPGEAFKYKKIALSEAAAQEKNDVMSEILIDLGYWYKDVGNLQLSLNSFNRARRLADQSNHYLNKLESLTGLGNLYKALNMYDKALEMHFEALKLKEEKGDTRRMATSFNNIGLVYYKIDYSDRALDFFNRALDIKHREGDTLRTIITYNNMGLVYNEILNDSMAMVCFKKAIDISKRYRVRKYLGPAYNGLANVYIRCNNVDSAHHYLILATLAAREFKSPALQSTNHYLFAKLYAEQDQFTRAREYLDMSQEIALEIKDRQRQKNNLKLMARIFESKQEYDSAYFFQKQYSALEDSIFNERLAESLAKIQIAMEEDQNLKLIESQEEKLAVNKLTSLFLLSIIVLAVALIIVVFKSYRTTSRVNLKLHETKQQIEKQKENLEAKNQALAEAQGTIHKQNQILKNLNQNLEQKVRERTDELLHSNKGLEKAVKDLDQFIYKTSHDLRGPIATMQGIIHLGTIEAQDAKSAEYFKTLHQVTGNLNNVLFRLIDVHETYQKKPEFEIIFPNREIMETIKKVTRDQNDPTVTIHADLDQEMEWVSDRALFVVIIENMLRNAYLYADKGDARIRIKSTYRGDVMTLTFSDNGFGIQSGDEKKVFNLFFKGSPKPGGTGLEIYTAKIAVEKLGGSIRLVSPVKDTVYEVDLPVVSAN